MATVQLYLDPDGLIEPTADDFVLVNVADYAPAYVALTDALHADEPLRILVRHTACAAWLQVACAKYGSSQVSVHRVSYRQLLEERWGIEVPSWVSDADLVASRLLDLPPWQPLPGQGFEEMILDAFWGGPYVLQRLPLGRLAELANAYDAEHWAAAEQVPIARVALARRLRQWREAAERPGERWLVELLQRSPEKLDRILSQIRVLAGYPEQVGIRAMGARYQELSALGLDLGTLSIDRSALTEVEAQIQVHLHSLEREALGNADLEVVLEQMSGELLAEFGWVERLLKTDAIAVTETLLTKVERVFRPIRYRITQQMDDLSLMIEPPRPSEPQDSWHIAEWMRWAVDEYLPYRFWLEAKAELDDEVADYACTYADWLFATFPGLIGSYENLVYRALINLRGKLQDEKVLLFLMLDNFGFRFADELCDLMGANGYRSSPAQPYLSMLPSATVVSKKAMANGQPYPFSGTAYKNVVEKTWSEQFGRDTLYLGQIGQLKSLSAHEHGVYVLNYTPLDDALHSDPRVTGISHAQAVRQALASLADSVHAFALRLGIEDHLQVVVCSDHGSTLIPAATPNLIDTGFIAKRVEGLHHRYVALNDAELDSLPETTLDQCYCFRKKRFDLDSNYLAARGYGRFRSGDTASYVHGGLTPEETLVPYLIFERTHIVVIPPTVRLLDNVFRYGVRSQLHLEIVNTNPLPFQNVTVEIVRPQGSAPSYVLQGVIEAQEVAHITMEDVRFKAQEGELDEIAILLSYECAGQQQRDEHVFAVTMRRLMTSSFDFEGI